VVAKQWQKFIRALCPDLSHAGKTKHARLVLGLFLGVAGRAIA